jgi:hypothetical protein
MTSEYLSRRSFLKIRELATDFAVHAIAGEVGVSPDCVTEVISGERQPSRIVVDDDHPLRDEMLEARRCHGCGALVFTWPCLACAMQSGSAAATPRISGRDLKYKRSRTSARSRARSPT